MENGSYFISSAGTSGQVWTSDGSGVGGWASTGSFTTASASTALKTPLIEYTDGDDAITIADGGAVTTAGNISVGGSNNELRFYEGSNYVGFEAPALSADQIWVLPAVDGSSGQVLATNSSGTLSWATRSSVADATDLSDVLVEATGSIYVGNDPSGTTNSANYNVALGTTALDAITTGDENVAVGYDALTTNTTGAQNTAVGKDALKVNADGGNNSAFGYGALDANTSASNNSAFGSGALGANITGAGNAAVGYSAAASNTTGANNVAIGYQALQSNTTAAGNIAIGYQALYDANRVADVSAYNIAIGYQAGNTGSNDITTGTNNILIGKNTAASAIAADNQIVIGTGASGLGNDMAIIGNTDVDRLYAAQDGQGVLYANATIESSDSRIKKNINDLGYGLDFINSLRPVTYYKKDPMDYSQDLKDKFYPKGNVRTNIHEIDKVLQLGFIAQEVKQVNDEMGLENNIVSVDEDGFHRMDYQKIVVPLVKAVQEQQDQIENLLRKYEELAAQNQKLLDMISN